MIYFRDCINSVDQFGRIDMLMLSLQICEHGHLSHLFKASLISLSNVLLFSVYNSRSSFVKFIPKYSLMLL